MHHIRKSNERGHVETGWLTSDHSFSFGEYFDESNMGFGTLRVLNDDRIEAGNGFPPHSHRNMEIFTIPLSGQLAHEDSMGNSSTIIPGQIQIMSAGNGVTHAEWNASNDEPLSLLQIWVTPTRTNILPRYEERTFSFLEKKNIFHEVINPLGEHGALSINQETYVQLGKITSPQEYRIHKEGNGVFIFIIEGSCEIHNETLSVRDTIMIQEEKIISITPLKESFVLIIETRM